MYGSPSTCQGNYTCDSRIPHICYNGLDVADMETPWANNPEEK